MNWTEEFIKAIDYIEEHLTNDITNDDIANSVGISSFYFQKVFLIYTNFTVAEYIRSRRLYQAALEVRSTDKRIIDIALEYGYETPEAFTKAFTRFHGYTPSQIRNSLGGIKLFLPLRVEIHIKGGEEMDYCIEKESRMSFIGFKWNIKDEEGYKECPKCWDVFSDNIMSKINDGSAISAAIKKYMIGAYAICKAKDNNTFDYYICGKCDRNTKVEGLEVVELDDSLWAKFKCCGPLPGALQAVNTKIWNDWIPNNTKYKLNGNIDIEYYSDGDVNSEDYKSEIWLPVKEQNK